MFKQWTAVDRAQAQPQGWDLFRCETGLLDTNVLQIQRIRDEELFDSDEEAHAFVRQAARDGSRVALKALKLHDSRVLSDAAALQRLETMLSGRLWDDAADLLEAIAGVLRQSGREVAGAGPQSPRWDA